MPEVSRSPLRISTATFFLLALIGCGAFSDVSKLINPPPATYGSVVSGSAGVSDATVQLYAAGSAGDGSAASPLLTPAVTTNSAGAFNLGSFDCPSADTPVYAVATAGSTGNAQNNPNLTLMAALGNCGQLTPTTPVVIDEVTTVAAVYALAPFMDSATAVGSATADAPTLTNAFALAAEYANATTGLSPGTGLATGVTDPVDQINTLTDLLASCAGTSGGKAGDGSACGSLFSLTTPSGGSAPAYTADALLNLAKNPTLNTSALFALVPASGPYLPMDL